MTQATTTRRERVGDAVASVVIAVLLLALWAGVSFMLLMWAISPRIKFLGDVAIAEEIAASDRREPWAIAGAALLAALIAAFFVWVRRNGAAWLFGLLAAATVALPLMAAAADNEPAPYDPGPRHCVERSGGDNDCPGG